MTGRISEKMGTAGIGTHTVNTATDNRLTTAGVGVKVTGQGRDQQ